MSVDGSLAAILAEIRELRRETLAIMSPSAAKMATEEMVHTRGLLSYEDLAERLTIGITNPRRPCLRRVKQIVRKNRHILKPVTVGGCSVGFRATAVERLMEHLANAK